MSAGTRSKSKSLPTSDAPHALEEYAALPYRLEITQGEHGNFVVRYPDLPGCITQVERLDDVIPAAREILTGWLEIALADGQAIPLPWQREKNSGKFMVRTPKSLHRALAAAASLDGTSLNSYVTTLLAAGETWHTTDRGLSEISDTNFAAMDQRLPQSVPFQMREHRSQDRGAIGIADAE